jgi:hypothetical protein
MRENALRDGPEMFGQRSRNARRHWERRTVHRHSSGVVRADRTARINVPSSRSTDERTGGARARSAQRTVPGGTGVRRVGRPGSADAERGTDASTDSTERSGCGDHHGRPPFGLELAESSGSNVRPFATSEHYRHRNSERNPFPGISPELHSRRRRHTARLTSHRARLIVLFAPVRWVRGYERARGRQPCTGWRSAHGAPRAARRTDGRQWSARLVAGLQSARCDICGLAAVCGRAARCGVGGPVAACALGAG